MNNSLALATITAVLHHRLKVSAQRAVPGTKVRIGPPRRTETDTDPEISICLYRITPSAGRTQHLPIARPDGTRAARHETAYDLRYLVSVSADAPLVAELLLAGILTDFDGSPVLTAEQIDAAVRSGAYPPLVGGPGLPPQLSGLEIIAEALSLEELSFVRPVGSGAWQPLVLPYLVRSVCLSTAAGPAIPSR